MSANDVSGLYSVVDKSKKITVSNKNYVAYDVGKNSSYGVADNTKTSDGSKIETAKVKSNSQPKDMEIIPEPNEVKVGRNCLVSILALNLSIIAIILAFMIFIMVIVLFAQLSVLSSETKKDISRIDITLQNLTESPREYSFPLLQQQNSKISFNISSSCGDIYHRSPSSSSGYYLVRSSTGHLASVYCDMNRTCGSITGGWMRVAELDTDNCPTGLVSKSFNGTKTCIRSEEAPGCTLLTYATSSIQHSKICGKIRAYAFGTLSDSNFLMENFNLTDNYLDGVSITSSGKHIWSFAASNCRPCEPLPSFIGNDWTCDGPGCNERTFCDTLLWNNNKCGETNSWFFKQLLNPNTADLELRVCRDEWRHNEDIALTTIELYVQ